ncbi:MAG: hypothetical protein GXP31_02145 [Kiritimatiellaeota bacterium]|nr:hypothetical protein [Kiritimatiellota bacterium]
MEFRDAVKNTPDLQDALQRGLQALNNTARAKVRASRPRDLRGSVDLDGHLKKKYPKASRWDYAIGVAQGGGVDDRVVYVELHPAHTGEVRTVLNKYSWLRSWLRSKAPDLDALPASYHWIATSGVHISKGSPQVRQLAISGIRVSSRLELT